MMSMPTSSEQTETSLCYGCKKLNNNNRNGHFHERTLLERDNNPLHTNMLNHNHIYHVPMASRNIWCPKDIPT